MREIDDRYPEYAYPYEPVRTGRHHPAWLWEKEVYYRRPRHFRRIQHYVSEGLAIVALIVLLLSPHEKPTPETLIPPTPTVGQSAEPMPSPTVPAVPSPSPSPAPEPTAEPEPSPSEEPAASPSPTVTPSATPTPTDPPATITEPTVSLSHIYYWEQVDHVEIEYQITPNDATGISSTAVVTSSADPSLQFSVGPSSGGGTITIQKDVLGLMEPRSADSWTVELTLNYTLDGAAKTKVFSLSASPEQQGLLRLYNIGTTASGAAGSKNVKVDLGFYYPSAYRHSFDLQFTSVKLGWMDSAYNVVAESEMRTVWDGSGACPISGPTGPESDGEDRILKYTYTGTVNATPSAAAAAAGATHFYLIFETNGTASDSKDGAAYAIRDPSSVRSFPQPIASGTLTAPTLDFSHLWYWGEFNISDMGVQLFELAYTVTPNDATDISVDAKLTYDSTEYSWTGLTDTGLVKIKQSTGGEPFCNSVMEWTPSFTLHYKLGGAEHSDTLSFPAVRPTGFKPSFVVSLSGDTIGFVLTKDGADPMDYSVPGISAITIEWYEKTSEYGWSWLGADPLWPGGGTLTVISPGESYQFSYPLSTLAPPAGATHFMVYIETGDYTGVYEGTSYVGVGGAYAYSDFIPVSELNP